MSLKRHATKRDVNEPDIIDALEKIGATVIRTDLPFDLIVGDRGKAYLAEVKNPDRKTNSKNPLGLTPGQKKTLSMWNGNEVPILETPEQAIAWLQKERSK